MTSVLGASADSVWCARQGAVTVVTATGRIVDTGVPLARTAVIGGRLHVYPGDRVTIVEPDGRTTSTPTPVAYDGAELAYSTRVWRRMLSRPDAEVLEVFDAAGPAWTRSVHGLSDPPNQPWVERIEIRPDRYIVLWSSEWFGTWAVELLTDSWYGGTGTGTCSQTWRWSGGVLACAEDGWNSADAFVWFEDFGRIGRVDLPPAWGWGRYAFRIREDAPGRPWVESTAVPEFVPFLLGSSTRALPGETTHALFWVAGGAVLLADATTLGTRHIVMASGGGWVPVPALATFDTLTLVGEFGARIVLDVRDPATGHRVVAFDAATGIATTLVAGLASAAGPAVAFDDGFAFAADDGVHGREPWFSRGTPDTTWLLADVVAGSAGCSPRDLHALDTHLAFVADDPNGTALFVLDKAELDWRRSPVDGRYYRLSASGGWFDAAHEATRRGGTLATIRSAVAQQWLWDTFGPQDLWIGLADLDRDGSYAWVSGEPLTFTAWCPGEPTPPSSGEDVVHLVGAAGSCLGAWANAHATDSHRGLVERTVAPRASESFGAGCDATAFGCDSFGATTLALEDSWPVLGAWLHLVLDTRQDPTVPLAGALAIGFDNALWGAVPLPFDLHPLGFPVGCALRVAPEDVVAVAVDPYGRGRYDLAVPNDPALRGGTVFFQGLALGVRVDCSEASNGLRLLLRS